MYDFLSPYTRRYRHRTTLATPTPITSFPIGNPSGQQPTVLVRDISNGFDLYTKNPDTQSVYPASCMKMLTMLLAWDYHQSDWTSGTVLVTAADVAQPYGDATISVAGLQANDVVTWEGLLYCAALASGGDACQAIARVIGDEVHTATGTGTSGITRFVELMQAKATALGLTNTTCFDPFGGSKTTVTRSISSARDIAKMMEAIHQNATLRAITGTTTHGVTITGVNARTLTTTHTVFLLNGPTVSPTGVRDADTVCGKTGTWVNGSDNAYNQAVVWTSPAGYNIVIATLQSESDYCRTLDQRGIIYSLLKDFPYLSASAPTDPNFASVKLLVGGAGTDESSVGRTVTQSSITTGAALVGSSSLAIDNLTDSISVADAADLNFGSGDFTIELWYAADGAVPSAEYVFGIKNTGSAQREFAFNWLTDSFNIFGSGDGSNWTVALTKTLSSAERAVFFNGATRHIALVKQGSTWAMYLCGERLGPTISVGTVFNGTGNLSLALSGAAPKGRIDEYRVSTVARYTANMVTILARKFSRS